VRTLEGDCKGIPDHLGGDTLVLQLSSQKTTSKHGNVRVVEICPLSIRPRTSYCLVVDSTGNVLVGIQNDSKPTIQNPSKGWSTLFRFVAPSRSIVYQTRSNRFLS
jgi:hypothetical protein